MRIIAGSKRGMHLLSPKTPGSRPITDRVKESLFSVLYKYDQPMDAIVADLFCGVGSLGLEALSRGAKFVTFVEKDPRIIAILKKNIDKARFANESKVTRANAFMIGAPTRDIEDLYDLVFIDPPYSATTNVGADSALSGLLDILGDQTKDNGIVIVRTSHDVSLLDRYGSFRIEERRQWGTMTVTILTKTQSDIQHTQDDIQENDE
jgi:16S rRNA (guanine966-N2)-methyltransferase